MSALNCSCDWWCQNVGDCCDVSSNKDRSCPDFAPRLNKALLESCWSNLNVGLKDTKCTAYKPGQCWCDAYCAAAKDCCKDCPTECPGAMCAAHTIIAAANPDAEAAVAAVLEGTPAQLAAAKLGEQALAVQAAANPQIKQHDCGIQQLEIFRRQTVTAASPTAWVSATGQTFNTATDVEAWLQRCQATDTGRPPQLYTLPVNWVQAVYCENTTLGTGSCTGNEYGVDVVKQQIGYLNAKYARVGLKFTWNGVINTIQVPTPVMNMYSCMADTSCVECTLAHRTGGDGALHVMTTPDYIGGWAVGE